jgi:hypothetical protein
MHLDTGKLQILTAAAILVLISGGIAAYAQDKNFSIQPIAAADQVSSSSTTTSSSNQASSATSKSTAAAAVTTSTTTTAGPLCTPPEAPGQVGRLTLPISPGQSQAGTVVFGGSKGCVASIATIGGVFNVQIALRYAKPVTQYNVVLVANGTSYTLGNMVTGPEGSGQMQNQVLLKTGTYVVSIQIFDTSTTPGTNTLVMQSAQGTIVSAAFPAAGAYTGHSEPGQTGNNEKNGS